MTDACNSGCADMSSGGHTTTYIYADNPGNGQAGSNAYLTLLTKPTVNGTAQQEKFAYTYEFGLLTPPQDVNNSLPTTYGYNDPLNRLRTVTGPPNPLQGGQSLTSY